MDAVHHNLTVADIYGLPDGERAELIDGVIYNMAPPSRRHQDIVSGIHADLVQYVRKKGGTCKVYPAPFAVFLNKDDLTYVEPDISVVCDPSKLDDRGCNGAPDLIIEVVSPSSQRMDNLIKLFKYRSAGVREYWIVNPMTKCVQTYLFENMEDSVSYMFEDRVVVRIYGDLELRIADYL